VSVTRAFELALTDYARTRQTRALADVVSSGNAGVLPPSWLSEVIDTFDARRYLVPRVGRVGFPTAGYSLTVPKILQHTTVAARGTEKTQVPSQALTTGSDTYTAKWFAGAVDIAVELLAQSDPSILALVVNDMAAQYAVAVENSVVTDAEAAATAEGAALDTSSYDAFVADVVPTAEAIRAATGAAGNQLALTTASWTSLLGMVDADGRRVLSTSGPSNADGSANLLAESVNVGGINAFHSPYSTVDLQFNADALRIAEKPPMQLATDNVTLMGRDVGIIGAVITLPLIPAGIIAYTA